MTGRGAGFCAGFGVPGFANRAGGYGFFGRGRGGGGRGWRHWFYGTGLTGWQRAFGAPWGIQGAPGLPYYGVPAREDELSALKEQAGYFESALENIRKRIEALETKTTAG
jgi:hypothetical protein